MPAKILVIGADPAAHRLASYTLRHDGYIVVEAAEGADAASVASAENPDLVLIDAAMPDSAGYELAKRIRGRATGRHVPIIMVTAGREVSQRARALRAGADETLDGSYHPADLVALVRTVLIRYPPSIAPAARHGRGRVFSFYGAKGGVGTTTIAVNTAIALERYADSRVALVDGNLQFGDHRVFLDMGLDRKGILDVVAAPAIDADLITSAMLRHDSGIDVLLAPLSPEAAELVTADHLPEILEHLRAPYDFVFIDLDHRLDDINLRVMDAADSIFIVMTADLPSLKNTGLLLDTFKALGFVAEKVRLILNRSTAVTGIRPRSMEAALGREIDHLIVNDYARAISSLNSGTPFMVGRADSRLGDSILEFARSLNPRAAIAIPRPEMVQAKARRR